MKQDRPILSIVIPSRNRAKYAISCIHSILNINDNCIEVVVHDNSDTNELEQYLIKNINDKRLVYHYDSSLMSTVDNFNRAMHYVNGEYICFIGDDDGINPEILEAALWAKNKDIDAVVNKILLGYNWPNDVHLGTLHIFPFSGKCINVNVKDELESFLRSGGVHYLEYNLPKIYHGLVRKECFDKVKNELGYYFGGLSVDIFSSISISLVANRVVAIDYPLTIAGSSPIADQTHRTEAAKNLTLANAPHFRGIPNYTWSERVPHVYSLATIWAESSIKALDAFRRVELLNMIDSFKLAALIAKEFPKHEEAVLRDFLNKNSLLSTNLKYLFTKLSILFFNIAKKTINRVNKFVKGKHSTTHTNISNINNAVNVFQEYLIENKLNIKKYLKD